MVRDSSSKRSHPAHAAATVICLGTLACEPAPSLSDQLATLIEESGAETVGIYYKALYQDDSLLINADVRMHAASMMKVPVMIRLFDMAEDGIFAMSDSVTISKTFSSIVDGSSYDLSAPEDSDTLLYDRVGNRESIRELTERMITVSSNLATNILIELADARQTTLRMREFGADSIEVLRGVEDIKAFELGLSNTTTARDLGIIFTAIAENRAGTEEACREMLAILKRQAFGEGIPAGVPEGTPVAHKTGSITEIRHDGGIVFPEQSSPYVLVVLTRGIPDPPRGDALIAAISRRVYEHVTE